MQWFFNDVDGWEKRVGGGVGGGVGGRGRVGDANVKFISKSAK